MSGRPYTCFLVILLSTSVYSRNVKGKNLGGPRIVNGDPANIADYPYQVSIRIDGDHACGGSILTENFILTAAHCTFDVSAGQLQVQAGSSYKSSGGQVVSVRKINVHNNFNIDTYDYDVSVLELASSLSLSSTASPVQLISNQDISDGVLANVTGWGLTQDGGSASEQLQVVVLPTISTTSCKTYYGAAVTSRMFCAGYEQGGSDTCQGDSGGPLVSNGIQIGIVSWGDICAAPNAPGVYTKISEFRSYIDSIVN